MQKTVSEKKRVRPLAGLTPYTGTFGREQVIHLLKRTMFGAKKSDVDYFTGKTLTAVVNELMTVPAALTPEQMPLRNYEMVTVQGYANPIDDPHAAIGKTWVYAPVSGPTMTVSGNSITIPNLATGLDGQRRNSFKSWWTGQMVNQTRSVFEKMVLFWHNHFATETNDTNAMLAFWSQMILRRNAMGNFKTFVREMTLDPNMLMYLNGRFNVKTAPDENYARELQELFTLGKGPASQYTEDDVKAAAKVLTGWSFAGNNPDSSFNLPSGMTAYRTTFNVNNHDTGTKQFSSFFGNKTIVGSPTANTQMNAERELDEMLNMIFAQNEVAMFICRKLYRHFVYYTLDATIEAEVIKPMADLFKASWDIKAPLKALLLSEHFHEAAQKACFIKSPLEFVVGMAREFDIQMPASNEVIHRYMAWNSLHSTRVSGASSQGQNIGDPPNVAGWPAYYQEPVYHEFWVNTDTLPKRMKFMETLLPTNTTSLGLSLGTYAAFPGITRYMIIDVLSYTKSLGTDARDPNILIDVLLQNLYRVPPTQAMRNYMKNILLNGQTTDYYWTDAWDAYTTNPSAANTAIVKPKLITVFLFLMRNPEYQLI
jgi:uncharacterized protein (DUF1800 family)